MIKVLNCHQQKKHQNIFLTYKMKTNESQFLLLMRVNKKVLPLYLRIYGILFVTFAQIHKLINNNLCKKNKKVKLLYRVTGFLSSVQFIFITEETVIV